MSEEQTVKDDTQPRSKRQPQGQLAALLREKIDGDYSGFSSGMKNPNRSNSAPPTQPDEFGIEGETTSPTDPRNNPEYAAWYYQQRRLDPRLPPPVYKPAQSWQIWSGTQRSWDPPSHQQHGVETSNAQSVHHGSSGPHPPPNLVAPMAMPIASKAGGPGIISSNASNNNGGMGGAAATSTMIAPPPGIPFLSTEPIFDFAQSQYGKNRSGAVSPGSPGRKKNLVDMIQEDFPRTPSPVFAFGATGPASEKARRGANSQPRSSNKSNGFTSAEDETDNDEHKHQSKNAMKNHRQMANNEEEEDDDEDDGHFGGLAAAAAATADDEMTDDELSNRLLLVRGLKPSLSTTAAALRSSVNGGNNSSENNVSGSQTPLRVASPYRTATPVTLEMAVNRRSGTPTQTAPMSANAAVPHSMYNTGGNQQYNQSRTRAETMPTSHRGSPAPYLHGSGSGMAPSPDFGAFDTNGPRSATPLQQQRQQRFANSEQNGTTSLADGFFNMKLGSPAYDSAGNDRSGFVRPTSSSASKESYANELRRINMISSSINDNNNSNNGRDIAEPNNNNNSRGGGASPFASPSGHGPNNNNNGRYSSHNSPFGHSGGNNNNNNNNNNRMHKPVSRTSTAMQSSSSSGNGGANTYSPMHRPQGGYRDHYNLNNNNISNSNANSNNHGSTFSSGGNGQGSGTASAAAAASAIAQVRSPLLDEFRSSKTRRFEIRDIVGHITEFAGDQHGSRLIQLKLESCSVEEKQLVFVELLPNALQLMTDVFGNYVIQKFFEHGNQAQKQVLAKQMEGHVLSLSMQMYGCRVVQKALEHVLADQQASLVKELNGHVLKCVKDQNGNHVIQKAIERIPPSHISFIISSFYGQVYSLATHPYGCRVIQRLFENITDEKIQRPLLQELHRYTGDLVQDQYGNYVIQHIIEKGHDEDRALVIDKIRGNVLNLSKHKFASNVVEKCVAHGNDAERKEIMDEVFEQRGENSGLATMMKDQYANYVVQRMLDVVDGEMKDTLIDEIKPHIPMLKKYNYGKHIITKVERMISNRAMGRY